MNVPNVGKYASVGDLNFTPQIINYHRGYGYIVIHKVHGDNTVDTNITKWNRIEPLTMQFGEHLPNSVGYTMVNPQTTIAWAEKNFNQ